jgi:SAM-dependent methyltransferase
MSTTESPANVKEDVRRWWAARPMTYGQLHGEAIYAEGGRTEAIEFGTKPFLEKVDKTFYSWNEELHNEEGYFGRIFPYREFAGKNVLEVGCGMGTMAMNWAQHGAKVVAVDLNPVAVAQTSNRLKLFGLPGQVMEMDGTNLTFPSNSFDYVYSWGVLHHSPRLDVSLKELIRVLRPGGRFGLMLYNRQSVYYWYLIRYMEGFLHGESRFLDRLALSSRYTDAAEQEGNPYTWPVTRREIRDMLGPQTTGIQMKTLGRIDFAFPPKIGSYLPKVLTNAWSRRWAWTLWATGTKTA